MDRSAQPVPGLGLEDKPPTDRRRRGQSVLNWFRSGTSWILVVVLGLAVGLAVSNPAFATSTNLINLALQLSVVAFLALGQVFVIIGSGIDLSSTGVLSLAGVLGASVMVTTRSPLLGVLTMLGIGLGFGLFNGLAVSRLRMVPFIVTLVSVNVSTGIATMYTKGVSIGGLPEAFSALGRRGTFAVPIPVLLVAVAYLVAHYALTQTAFGRELFAIGSNRSAAVVSGIATKRVILATYLISATCGAVAGAIMTARLTAASSGMGGDLLTMDCIAAAVIGGASLSGGKGSVIGTLAGVLLISLIGNGLNLFGVSHYLTIIVKGGVIFLAVLLDALRSR